ncbi:MAG: T9SS type A sorting domain-containing protein [Flavobacteriales bacterium]|nr:T9SS type A sorting domain-containing protein [Flavobacteriales bacterium]
MKKVYLLLLGVFAMTLSAFSQSQVTFRVNMKNESVNPNFIHIPGNYQTAAGFPGDWDPNDPNTIPSDLDHDSIYELTVTLPSGTYEYKYVNGNAWSDAESVPSTCATNGNRTFVVSTNDLVLDVVCFGSCTDCAATTFERDVTFMIIDSNKVFSNVKLKGAFNGWADFQAYDDGTNGDQTAGDYIFTAIHKVKNGDYEWGGTNNGNWVIKGPNVKFSMDLDGKITGDTVYGVPKLGALLGVIFNIDMSDEIVASEGVYVTGDFMEALESPIGNWDKDTLKLLPRTTGSDIYTATVKMYAGKYVWKVYNGINTSDPDAVGENYDFTSNGCGEPNGIGGHNRVMDFRGASTDQVLPTYKYNSCQISASVKSVNQIKFGLMPNPALDNVRIKFSNGQLVDHIEILDLTGRVVLTQEADGNNTVISLESIIPGVYMVNAYGENGTFGVQKLVKK